LIVGIDVHKHTHAAALLDERGGEIATLTFANSPKGYQRLLGWLDHYNESRRHSALGNRPPMTRVRDVLGHDS
jgi:transposase